MPLIDDKRALSGETFLRIRDFVYARSGIYIQESKKYLVENRLQRRIRELHISGFEEYIDLVERTAGAERNNLFNLITTRETSFFREPLLLDAFNRELLPRVLEKKRGAPVRIWSAGCSTGEEPYTLGMYLLERRGAASGVPILGSDISSDALASARRAVYGEYSLRNIPPGLRSKYFAPVEDGMALSPEVRRLVRFEEINLVDERRVRLVQGMDVVFCRNVMIYFDEAVKRKVASLFWGALNPGGFLFVGRQGCGEVSLRRFRTCEPHLACGLRSV